MEQSANSSSDGTGSLQIIQRSLITKHSAVPTRKTTFHYASWQTTVAGSLQLGVMWETVDSSRWARPSFRSCHVQPEASSWE
ncbi:hypothetical protein J6590_077433 [Homalodisca vitripennis]|nr:hypothetical protein J6590_077433 [Homalodisca vitripennis]